ncbi:MAG: hypothetical protein NG740_07210 [Omnitrophica bacterium]|nr:hypothetical protein [Candidatus Omnitrophota bacterium]
MGEQTYRDNGCNFFGYCLNELRTAALNCTCMNARYYLDKLQKKDGCCKVLEARKVQHKKRLSEEAAKKASQPEQREKQPQEVEEKQRTTNAAEFYIGIFDEFEADPLTDKQIADRLFALTGNRPTNRNISSYRCNYNQGKIKGQDKAPSKKVERKRK